jgi:hypothetical protein
MYDYTSMHALQIHLRSSCGYSSFPCYEANRAEVYGKVMYQSYAKITPSEHTPVPSAKNWYIDKHKELNHLLQYHASYAELTRFQVQLILFSFPSSFIKKYTA